MELKEALDRLGQLEHTLYAYRYAMGVMSYDSETAAPELAAEGRGEALGTLSEVEYQLTAGPETGLLLETNKLYLGRTLEYTKTDKFVPMLEGRSSVGRLGLFIHVTAGFGDVGFAGYWTLEMFCIHPIVIYPNVEICQIYYHTIQGDYTKYDSGKYQNNTGVQPSMLYKDFLREEEK